MREVRRPLWLAGAALATAGLIVIAIWRIWP